MSQSRKLRILLVLLALLVLLLPTPGCGTFGGSYYRLRGSSEIHVSGCPRLRGASRDGIVGADADDGPPCIECRHDDAVEWAND
jgi:hypothetical protein